MNNWYASQKLLAQIDALGKIYYCPLKRKHRVDDSGVAEPYQRIDELVWSPEELTGVEACQYRKARIQRNQMTQQAKAACPILYAPGSNKQFEDFNNFC